MHAGRKYSVKDFIFWSSTDIVWILIISAIPTIFYYIGYRWITLPWVTVALVGTAASFIVGFRNTAIYNRLWEARQIWGGIVNTSRSFTVMARDFISSGTTNYTEEQIKVIHKEIVYTHVAWLTALRFQLREGRIWEASGLVHNTKFREKYYSVPEWENSLEEELGNYLSEEDKQYILGKKNRASQLLSLQSKKLRKIFDAHLLLPRHFTELELLIKELYEHQGKAERIKNFPYPRQYSSISTYFVRLFMFMVPFGTVEQFGKMADLDTHHQFFVWLNIPIAGLVMWIFNAFERVGESSENPFEGSSNDTPITSMSRAIEIDIREMLDETNLPPAIGAENNILM